MKTKELKQKLKSIESELAKLLMDDMDGELTTSEYRFLNKIRKQLRSWRTIGD